MWSLTGKIDDRSEPMNENEIYNYTKYRKLINEASADGINITYDRNGSGLRAFDRLSQQELRSYGKMPARGIGIPKAMIIPTSGPIFNKNNPQRPNSDTISVKIGDVPVKEMFNYAFLAAFYVNPNVKKKEDITNEDLIRILTKGILPTLYEFNNANGYPKPQTVYMVRMMCSEIDKALGYTDMRVSKKYTYCVAFCIDPAYTYEQVQALYDSCGWIIPFFWVQHFDAAPYNESAFPDNPFITGK